jgi:hypothetical protein
MTAVTGDELHTIRHGDMGNRPISSRSGDGENNNLSIGKQQRRSEEGL